MSAIVRNQIIYNSKFCLIYCVKRCASNGNKFVDHYKTLGLQSNATAKEIKTAFYVLSKKYHPDSNPKNNNEKSAERFQNLVEAYEILGSTEKRKIYDLSMNKGRPVISLRQQQQKAPETTTHKSYTDIDIDYKDFEHFQKINRRKRVYRKDYEVPEFLRQMGKPKINSEWEHNEGEAHARYVFKDSRAFEREKEERRLAEELEEERRKSKYPLPTFEQLEREKQKFEQHRSRGKLTTGLMLLGFSLAIALTMTKGMRF